MDGQSIRECSVGKLIHNVCTGTELSKQVQEGLRQETHNHVSVTCQEGGKQRRKKK